MRVNASFGQNVKFFFSESMAPKNYPLGDLWVHGRWLYRKKANECVHKCVCSCMCYTIMLACVCIYASMFVCLNQKLHYGGVCDALVESTPFVRRVMSSIPSLAAT